MNFLKKSIFLNTDDMDEDIQRFWPSERARGEREGELARERHRERARERESESARERLQSESERIENLAPRKPLAYRDPRILDEENEVLRIIKENEYKINIIIKNFDFYNSLENCNEDLLSGIINLENITYEEFIAYKLFIYLKTYNNENGCNIIYQERWDDAYDDEIYSKKLEILNPNIFMSNVNIFR